MTADPQLINAQDLIVVADYGQIYIWPYSSAPPDEFDDDDEIVALAALDDATASGRFVGVRPGFIDVLIPPGRVDNLTELILLCPGQGHPHPPDSRDRRMKNAHSCVPL